MTREIKHSDRLKIFEILYPEAHIDTIMDSNINVEAALDEFGIPKYTTPIIYIMSHDKELKNKVNSFIKKHFDKIYK